MISEQDQISYILSLVKAEKAAQRSEKINSIFAVLVSFVLAYFSFGTILSSFLFGWITLIVVGVKNSTTAELRKAERTRAVAYFEGDLEMLQKRIALLKAEMGR